jgi:SAM-dependent methyltransferase
MTNACMLGKASRILLLGVTPELANFPWPEDAQLTAVDLHLTMIKHCWAGNKATRNAVCADWLLPPFQSHQFDNVIGDGCLTLLSYPDQYRELSRSMYRVIAPDGVWVMRQFCRPPQAESIEAVRDDLWNGKIGSVHALKWRIAMSVHADRCECGVVLGEIWQAYRDIVPDPKVLEDRFGWDARAIATLDNYRGSLSRYTFPTTDEIARAMPEFNVRIVGHGSYELADRCPILSMSPIPSS